MSVLNGVFLISGLLFLFSTIWLVMDDHSREWHIYQKDTRIWEVAMTVDAQIQASADQVARERRSLLKTNITNLRKQLADDSKIAQLEAELRGALDDIAKLKLAYAVADGKVRPKESEIERAKFARKPDAVITQLEKEILAIRADRKDIKEEIDKFEKARDLIDGELNDRRLELEQIEADLRNRRRQLDAIEQTLADIDPQGWAGTKSRISEQARNAPLADWFNPSLRPEQEVIPNVLTDLNVMKIETIDRCMSCHVNISEPRYEKNNLLRFVERQVIMGEAQSQRFVNELEELVPYSLLGFWIHAAEMAGLDEQVQALKSEVGQSAGLDEDATRDQLIDRLIELATDDPAPDSVPSQVYGPLTRLRDGLRDMLRSELGAEAFAALGDAYRNAAIDKLNEHRRENGLEPLSTSPVLLGHSRIDLFVGPESSHPMKSMGCTVCHEGAGQETQFEHSAHTPRDVWVDFTTGAVVPDFLIERAGAATEIKNALRKVAKTTESAPNGLRIKNTSDVSESRGHGESGESGESVEHGEGTYSSADLYLPDPLDAEHPFAPAVSHGEEAIYRSPAEPTVARRAIKQQAYWEREFGWHHLHYSIWEKPMHELAYVESGCARCHSEIFDIKYEAPKLFKGRKLFAQLGCANCHAVGNLEDDLDIKKAGPSLVNVDKKLTAEMMASWIWSPRGFRPASRMPHYFMLENNSSSVDIRRTRTEVAAIVQYLRSAAPDPEFYLKQYKARNHIPDYKMAEVDESFYMPRYQEETLQEEHAGDGGQEAVDRGRELFNTVGCLACHSNLEDQGRPWIVNEVARQLGKPAEYVEQEMTYNERHWFALRYLGDKLTVIGPELSGVGTKLLAGRPPDSEGYRQAKQWLYNWLRNPRNHSSYTIMPVLRLDEQQARDVADYLLAQRRPGSRVDEEGKLTNFDEEGGLLPYEPGQFGFDREMAKKLCKALVISEAALKQRAQVLAGQTGQLLQEALDKSRQEMIGQKLITHYGCAGCHRINGFEDATSACTSLEEWGFKDPHKIDFGYFDHVHNRTRPPTEGLWKVDHEGLAGNAAHITQDSAKAEGPSLHRRQLQWEHLHHQERRPWLYLKLHNPRIYDRGRTTLNAIVKAEEPDEAEAGVQQEQLNIGRPYDKLKMPKFFLRDQQVRNLVTFVTSIRSPLVRSELLEKTYDRNRTRIARGRQVATMYNCYGCHNIEGEPVAIQKYYGIYNADGTRNDNPLNRAPPRLIGQGAKTQPDWLYHFLRHVNGQPNISPPGSPPVVGENRIRPWLKVRMPSFPLTEPDAKALVDYFASYSQELSIELRQWVSTIDAYLHQLDPQLQKIDGDLAAIERQFAALSEQPEERGRLDRRKKSLTINRGEVERQIAERRSSWFDSDNDNVRRVRARMADYADRTDLIPNQRRLDGRYADPDERQAAWDKILVEIRVLADAWQTDYPYVSNSKPVLTDQQFARGEGLFVEMGCMLAACHRMGEKQVLVDAGIWYGSATAEDGDDEYGEEYGQENGDDYGDDEEGYGEDEEDGFGEVVPGGIAASDVQPEGAPNLSLTVDRLQRQWVGRWIQHPHIMQPGTRMLPQWPEDQSFFKALGFTGEILEQKDKKFGFTFEQQRRILLDFLYTAGHRRITYAQDGTRLSGAPQQKVEIGNLEVPKEAQPPKPAETPVQVPIEPAASKQVEPEVAPAPAPAPKVSKIKDFHGEEMKPYDGEGSRIIGLVKYTGKPSRGTRIRMKNDATCDMHWKGKPPPRTEGLLVNRKNRTLRNAVVYVSKGYDKSNVPQKKKPFIINQVGCVYTPHVVAVQKGQSVEIHSVDKTNHNVKFASRKNGEFNTSMRQGVVLEKKFNKVEKGARFDCSIHPWMSARMCVFEHPYFSVSDVEGKFEITGLKPGNYELEIWHEHRQTKAANKTIVIEVEDGTSHRLDVTMNGP